MSNRVSLAQIADMPQKEVQSLPTQHLGLLLEDLAKEEARVKKLKVALSTACDAKFSEQAQKQRRALGKDTGTVRIHEDDATVIADLPAKIEWDQPRLRDAVRIIQDSWKENPADYVSVKIEVSELKYKAWPPAIRALFEPARTVGVGKPTYKIELEEDRRAA